MGEFLGWWLAIEALGIVALPLAAAVFARLPDAGWTLSKPLGLLVMGWLVWFPLALVPALPFSRAWIVGTCLAFAAGNAALLRLPGVRASLRRLVARARGYLLAAELVFAGAFALLAWERSFTPGSVDTEKFMDAAFLSGIWRAPHLPPPDPWLSGHPINYYYFGHYLLALVAKALGTQPAVAFNLGIALIFGLTAVAVFGIAANLVAIARPRARSAVPAGLASAALVLVLGNLAGAGVAWQNATALAALHPPALSSPWAFLTRRDLWASYDWWTPSRIVPNTINEFPAFSFILADLHAHVLALPFVTLAVAVALNLLLADGRGVRAFGGGRSGLLTLGVSAVILGALYAINGWDLPTYLGLALLALAIQQWLAHNRRWSGALARDAALAGGALVALSVALYLPFYREFTSPSQGIGFVPGDVRSPIGAEFLIFGLPMFILVSLLLVRLARWAGEATNMATDGEAPMVVADAGVLSRLARHSSLVGRALVGTSAAVLVLLTVATATYAGWTSIWAGLIVLGCAALVLRRLGIFAPAGVPAGGVIRWRDRAEVFVLCLAGTAAALVAVCEVVYLRDIFGGGQSFRMNTVFKLYFQVWLLAGLAAGPALVWLLGAARALVAAPRGPRAASAAASVAEPAYTAAPAAVQAAAAMVPRRASVSSPGNAPADRPAAHASLPSAPDLSPPTVQRVRPPGLPLLRWAGASGIVLWIAALALLTVAATAYPVLAASARTQSFTLPRTLDGTAYMANDPLNMGDGPAIAWLNIHIADDPVIVEAAKYDEYTHYGRISALTGLPTLLGWGGHELQWRVNWLAQPGRANLLGERLDAVNAIYTNPDRGAVLALLRRYAVRLVYVGAAERALYPGADLTRFGGFLRVIYQQDGVTIYAVP